MIVSLIPTVGLWLNVLGTAGAAAVLLAGLRSERFGRLLGLR